ncbi:MAG: CusA/CzcA family heavy metal efflux RND transporter [Verrucomicrobia bacterium]|nr:CusA/CzcA family heavy metal efflux RND transporter [Verrucomicrobiota bacterium]
MTTTPEKAETLIECIIGASAQNPFLVVILTLFAVAGGIFAISQIPLDAIPDESDVQVIIYTDWQGRSPDLIEDQISYPISTKFISAPKVKFVRAESMFGKSFVYVIFQEGTDIYWARSRVIEYLNSVRSLLPEGVNPVIGPDATGVGWVYEYALVDDSGKQDLAALRSFQDWHLKYALESVPGVAEVASVGGFVKEYQVDVDPNKLLAYNIPLSTVVNAIRASNADAGGKTFEISSTQFFVRGRGYIKNVKDIEDVVLTTQNSVPIFVKNIGTVHLGPDLRYGVTELNGKGEVAGGVVVMRYGENALKVIDGIKRKLAEIRTSFPPGVRVVPTYDRSIFINQAIDTLREKLIEESIVVALVCILFLWHVRSALVAIVTLPIAIVASFIPLYWLGLTSNIMSLGGIAIAIGAMIDAAIIMVENAHKALEHFKEKESREPSPKERFAVLIEAARSVGRPLFYSLLVITVSFIPVFSLGAQEGRLFRPLAFTKTFAMFFAAIAAVTLVPVLMTWLIRGKITPERRNPINRGLMALYDPIVHFVLRYRWPTLLLAIVVLGLTWLPFSQLGTEFMPPLNEGTLLYMPTAIPGMSITEATKILQIQDRILRQFPEVESVFGKAGQADTATDPAPLSMFETVVQLKPPEQWPAGITWQKLVAQLNDATKTPGMAQIFWMPIQTRTEMLTTGFRSILGIKVFGPDLKGIEDVAVQIEKTLSNFPNTRSAFAERTTRGYFLDFAIDREAAARYGLRVEDVNQIVESAIGGNTIGTTVEGRERYPISIRYARDFRTDIESLKRTLVATPTGAQVPISLLAQINYRTGPPSIREENAQLVGYIFVDITNTDIDGYVRGAAAEIEKKVHFPQGYYIQWAGQFQYLKEAEQRLAFLVPLTLLIVFLLIYLNTKSVIKTLIVLLAVPFSLVGAFWMLYLLHYNMSVAVWVGLIALAGLDAETGVVMLLYLDQAWEKFQREDRMTTVEDLFASVKEGAVQRIRPKMMTVSAIIFGLLPIMWSPVYQAGADVMKRIAAPMIGGVVTSAVLELVIYPVIFVIWKKGSLPKNASGSGALNHSAMIVSPKRRVVLSTAALLVVSLTIAIAYFWSSGIGTGNNQPVELMVPVVKISQDGVTVSIMSSDGTIRAKENTLAIRFADRNGHPVNAAHVRLDLSMNMPGMVMHSAAKIEKQKPSGEYVAHLTPDMAGDWSADISYQGPKGLATLQLPISVKQ